MRRSTRIASTAINGATSASTAPTAVSKSTPKQKPATSKATLSKVPAKVAKQEPPIKSFASPTAFETYVSSDSTPTTGIWLVLCKKSNPVQTVTYDQALDVALCHGWIDGQRKTHDEHSYIQRFTPRRKNSLWSKRNVDKVAELIADGRMGRGGWQEIELAKQDGRWEKAYGGASMMEVPDDLDAALGKKLRLKFDALSRGDKYSLLWKIQTALKDDVRKRRVEAVVKQVKDMD